MLISQNDQQLVCQIEIYIYTWICIGLIPYKFIKPSLKFVSLYWFYVNKHIYFQTLPKFNFLSPNIYTPIIFIFISCQRSPSALLLSPPCECIKIKTVAAEINSRLSLSVTESQATQQLFITVVHGPLRAKRYISCGGICKQCLKREHFQFEYDYCVHRMHF